MDFQDIIKIFNAILPIIVMVIKYFSDKDFKIEQRQQTSICNWLLAYVFTIIFTAIIVCAYYSYMDLWA